MNETKSPEPVDFEGKHSGAVRDPNQTQLLPAHAVFGKQDVAGSHGADSGGARSMVEEPKPKLSPGFWSKKLSQSQIIWISFSIILVFLVIYFWLIMQGRHKKNILKPAAGGQFEEAAETSGLDTGNLLKNRLARQAVRPDLLLTDDEFAGLAPTAVKASGWVISAATDPELAAMVDALKKRSQIFANSQSINRGNIVTKVSKGEFRGFKINVEEKLENQRVLSEEVVVTMPKKGYIKTVNRTLESIRESDLERFVLELKNAGLEIIKLPVQPGSKFLQVQIRAVSNFGKPVAADLLLSGKRVGKISLGMPTAHLENMLLSSYVILKRKVLVNDIYHDVYKVLDQSNEPLFFVYEKNSLVWGIAIISENFKTDKGIGIGSSLGDIRVNYPRVKVGISDKKIPFVRIDDVDGLFVVQNDGVDMIRRIFPSKTKVISILIGNSLEFE
jgi:tetrahydromethanopterin S-methyltransferase subunit F